MTRRWSALALVTLVFAFGCKKKELQQPEGKGLEEAALAQQRAQESRLAEQRALEEQQRLLRERPAAQAEETTRRGRSAQEAADQQRSAVKVSGKGPHLKTDKSESPHKVLAAHQEVVALAPVAAAPGLTTLHFRNDAGTTFRLVEAHFVMDGAELPVVIKAAEHGKSYLVSSEVSAGQHALTTQLTYQGATQGVFNYMKGYTFKVTSDEMLSTTGAKAVSFTIVCKERTGLNTPLEKRLVISVEGNHTL